MALPWAENRSSSTDEFTLINTNARSLCPKVNSLIDCCSELDCHLAVVTETWLGDSPSEAQDLEDLRLSTGIATIALNRPPVGGVTYGGVAIMYREASLTLKDMKYPNPDKFETIYAAGSIKGHGRKLVVIAAYMPPGDRVPRARACIRHITEMISEAKRKFSEPLIVLAGDFNQWPIQEAVQDFVDMSEVAVGPTRGSRAIDRVFVNFGQAVTAKGTVEPLETESDGGQVRQSDHRVAYVRSKLQKLYTYEWLSYSYLYYNEESVEDFRAWIASYDWERVTNAVGSNAKAKEYQDIVTGALRTFFPTKTTRRKSTDLPWINDRIRKKIARRKAIFKAEGRSARWRRHKVITNDMIRKRRDGYFDGQRIQILAADACRVFFKNVRRYKSADKPPEFDVRTLLPGMGDQEVAEQLASYFNTVSSEFRPLEPDEIPSTFDSGLPVLAVWEVAGHIKNFRKPKSMVEGDIFPKLMTLFSDQLAIPLTSIYNTISATLIWPVIWKKEFVTVIPKTSFPQSLADLRNISCTMLASKIFELSLIHI